MNKTLSVTEVFKKSGMVWESKKTALVLETIDEALEHINKVVEKNKLNQEDKIRMVKSFVLKTAAIIRVGEVETFSIELDLSEKEMKLLKLTPHTIRFVASEKKKNEEERDEIKIKLRMFEDIESVEGIIEKCNRENSDTIKNLYPEFGMRKLFDPEVDEELERQLTIDLSGLVSKINANEVFKSRMRKIECAIKDGLKIEKCK